MSARSLERSEMPQTLELYKLLLHCGAAFGPGGVAELPDGVADRGVDRAGPPMECPPEAPADTLRDAAPFKPVMAEFLGGRL